MLQRASAPGRGEREREGKKLRPEETTPRVRPSQRDGHNEGGPRRDPHQMKAFRFVDLIWSPFRKAEWKQVHLPALQPTTTSAFCGEAAQFTPHLTLIRDTHRRHSSRDTHSRACPVHIRPPHQAMRPSPLLLSAQDTCYRLGQRILLTGLVKWKRTEAAATGHTLCREAADASECVAQADQLLLELLSRREPLYTLSSPKYSFCYDCKLK